MDTAIATSFVSLIALQLPVLLILFIGLVLSIILYKKNPARNILLSIAFLIMIIRIFAEALFTVLYGVNHLDSTAAENQILETTFYIFNKIVLITGWTLLLIGLFSPKLNQAGRSTGGTYEL